MRPKLDNIFMEMAWTLSMRAACRVRQVGCVVVDNRQQVVATGYNGKARGVPNCDAQSCIAGCEGVHAEVNALLQAGGRGACLYVTCAPCWHCMKTIINSGVERVVFLDDSTLEARTRQLAQDVGILLQKMPLENPHDAT